MQNPTTASASFTPLNPALENDPAVEFLAALAPGAHARELAFAALLRQVASAHR